jgi:pimeloyl-ACP methyl ester carboxylesterase
MLRRLLAVIAGLAVGAGIVFAVETLSAALYPLPPGTDAANAAAMKAFVAQLPTWALLLVLFGWGLGALAGGWVAARVAGRVRGPARVVGLALLGAAVFNMLTIPHPLWFWAVGVLIFLPAAELGASTAGAPGRRDAALQ